MKPPTRITDTEWEIMRCLWAAPPLSSTQILERLNATGEVWHPKTTRTLLGRLVKKKALRYQPQGRAYVYEPLVTERECITAASDSFLERVFGGSLKPMLAHFVELKRITKEDLKELSDLLEGRAEKIQPKPKSKK